jgi:hypothetical protein
MSKVCSYVSVEVPIALKELEVKLKHPFDSNKFSQLWESAREQVPTLQNGFPC